MGNETVLTDEQIEQGREAIFSTNNPYCPCDTKTMRKAARWAEQAVLQSDHIRTMDGMAGCMHMVRQEFIEAGIIDDKVAPMFVADAVMAEVQRLRERIKALEDGLRPFARDAEQWGFVSSEHRPMFWQLAGKPDEAKFIVGDLRHAVALLDQP